MNLRSVADMVTCLRTRRVLQAYLDGETDPDTTRKVAAHVAACRRCGLRAATYRAIKASLAGRAGHGDELTLHRLRAFTAALADSGGYPDATG
jgi:anti-sigma factor RsiW